MRQRDKTAARTIGTTVIELAGLAAISFGISLWSVPAAVIFAGVALIGVGVLIARGGLW